MSVDVPDKIPVVFSSGETVQYRRFVPDYLPSDGWTFALYLNGLAATLHKDGVADGDGFVVTIDPSDALPAGDYRYLERVSKFDTSVPPKVIEAHNVGDGVVDVELDLATADSGACVTHAERVLAIIEAQIEGKLSADLASYSIGGRIVSKIPIADLKKLRAQYRAEVFRIYNPGKLAPSIEIVFNPIEDTPSLPSTWVDITGIPE